MIRLCLLFILVALLPPASLHAQQLNYNQTEPFLKANGYWAWYDNNGLDFSSGSPVHDSTSLTNPDYGSGVFGAYDFYEGVASVADPVTGELLFYSNGSKVWNRTHNVMLNGDSLKGNWRVSTVQGTCIVPVIGSSDQYYLFSLCGVDTLAGYAVIDPSGQYAEYRTGSSGPGLYYSIVDMSLDNGNGGIVAGSKNIPLDTSHIHLESMIAIPGNNCNVWLVTHEHGLGSIFDSATGSKNYLVYEISETGVSSTPIISAGLNGKFTGVNHMSVSPDRSKIFHADKFASLYSAFTGFPLYSELVSFDVTNGTVSNGIAIASQPYHNYSSLAGAFSPNSNLLYLAQTNRFSTDFNPGANPVTLVQLDVSVLDSLSINSSTAIIDTLALDPTTREFPASLKYYNDQIYVFYAHGNTIGRINQPDLTGMLCDFQEHAIQLQLPYRTDEAGASPPSEVVFPLSKRASVVLDTAVCGEVALRVESSNIDSGFVWNTGHTDPVLYVDTPGVYWLNYMTFSENCIYVHTDTFIVRLGDLAVFPQINVSVDTLSTTVPYDTYQWMLDGDIINGATSSKYVVMENGGYQVIVSDGECSDTSDIYEVLNVSIKSLGESTGVYIYPNPTSGTITIHTKEAIQYSLYQLDGRMLIQNKQSNVVDLSGFSDGMYLLKLSDQSGKVVHYERISKVSR